MYNQNQGYAAPPMGYNQPMGYSQPMGNPGMPMTMGGPMPPGYGQPMPMSHNPALNDDQFPAIKIPDTQPFSQKCTCSACGSKVSTTVDKVMTCTGICFIILLVLIFWPLCWLPCCYDYSYKHVHTCPSCKATLSYTVN